MLGFRLRCSMALEYLENLVPPEGFPSTGVLIQSSLSNKVKVTATKHSL